MMSNIVHSFCAVLLAQSAVRERDPAVPQEVTIWVFEQLVANMEDPRRSVGPRRDWVRMLAYSLNGRACRDLVAAIAKYCDASICRIALCNFFMAAPWLRTKNGMLRFLKHNVPILLEKTDGLSYLCQSDLLLVLYWRNSCTPFRASLDSLYASNLFGALVKKLGIDPHLFAATEAPLIADGWTSNAIVTMLCGEPFIPDLAMPSKLHCLPCGAHRFVDLPRNAAWELYVERIKQGRSVDEPLTAGESEEKQEWDEYVRVFKEERKCGMCQARERAERVEASGEDGWVPFSLEW